MNTLRNVVIGSAVLVFANMAMAQSQPTDPTTINSPPATQSTPSDINSNSNINSTPPSQTSQDLTQTPTDVPSSAQTSPDPYVQKRQANRMAKDEYKTEKSAAKQDLKENKAAARAELRESRRQSAQNRNVDGFVDANNMPN